MITQIHQKNRSSQSSLILIWPLSVWESECPKRLDLTMRLIVDSKGNLIKVPLRNLARDTDSKAWFRAQRTQYSETLYIGYSLSLGNLPLIEIWNEKQGGRWMMSGREEVMILQQWCSCSMIQGRCSLTCRGTYSTADSDIGGYRWIQADTFGGYSVGLKWLKQDYLKTNKLTTLGRYCLILPGKKVDNLLMRALKTWAILTNDVPKGLTTFGRMLQIESNIDWTIYWLQHC